jgi:MoaA/NifB/PqqE/SkfB family radical SAM enzyme
MMISRAIVISGWRSRLVLANIQVQLFLFLLFRQKRISRAIGNLRNIQKISQQSTIERQFTKLVKQGNRLFFNNNIAGWPKRGYFDKLLELSQTKPHPSLLQSLGMVQIALTKKCPLNCEHCFEGKILNQPETTSLEDHLAIVKKLQQYKVPMIQFGGGEPMNRFNDLITILESASSVSDFWIYSSGYGLTKDKALRLKEAGLTGVVISIDHYNREKHNAFRRNERSFDQAVSAISFAHNAGLMTSLSICVTKAFCTEKDLQLYLEWAHQLKVPIVQIMEPRASGNYEGMDVQLNAQELKILDEFYISRNTEKKYAHLPLLQHTGFQQRTKGCAGSGNRYIYIDTDGFVQACPFCANRKTHFLHGNVENDIRDLKNEGCQYVKPKQLNHA